MRQNELLVKREKSRQRLLEKEQPSFHPKIAKQSLRYLSNHHSYEDDDDEEDEEGGGGRREQEESILSSSSSSSSHHGIPSFEARMQRYTVKRKKLEEAWERERQQPSDCSFAPTLVTQDPANAALAANSHGTHTHLAPFDQRLEMNLRNQRSKLDRLRKEREGEELKDSRPSPQISSYARQNGKSKLGKVLHSMPHESYVNQLREEEMRREMRRQQLSQSEREKEMEECSFQPKTTKCPSYIKRIAKSMSIAKRMREETESLKQDTNRPEWR